MIEITKTLSFTMDQLERGPIASVDTNVREAADTVEDMVRDRVTRLERSVRCAAEVDVDAEPGELLPGAVNVHLEVFAPDGADRKLIEMAVAHVIHEFQDEAFGVGGARGE